MINLLADAASTNIASTIASTNVFPAIAALNAASIGMFDSGLGGLTVMDQLLRVLPHEHVVYFGDTARLPYGDKSRETIIRQSLENAIFLLGKNVKILVVACSTASAHALERLQQTVNVPVIGTIEPGAERAVQISRNGRIGVLGTKGTIQSQAYQKAILQRDPHATVVSVACPLLVPLIEEHYVTHPAARLIVQEYLRPLREQQIDTLVLGCTHYPLLKGLISSELGDAVAIVDSATTCAEQAAAILTAGGLNRPHGGAVDHHYFVSDDPQKFQTQGRAFLGMSIKNVELI